MTFKPSARKLSVSLATVLLVGSVLGGIGFIFWTRTHLNQEQSKGLPVQPASESPPEPDQIVFAGLSGVPPKFFDSGPNQGQGWVENQTLEIRKGMKEDGFYLKQEYMTPARISHEFKRGAPICTYPVVWSHPEELFKKKPDRLYSIAVTLEAEGRHSILFKKANAPRFKQYIQPNGDLDLKSLLQDPSLKTLLVRDKDYGTFTDQLTELDSQGDQAVRPEYRDHVTVLLIRDNRQLIEMLNADRFDYIFSDSIENQDFTSAAIDRSLYDEKAFDTYIITRLGDPGLRQVSIACSIHPSTLKALPYFNKWIKLNRNLQSATRKENYKNKLEGKLGTDYRDSTMVSSYLKFIGGMADGSLDTWTPQQSRYFPSLTLLPPEKAETHFPPLPEKRGGLSWRVLSDPSGTTTLVRDSQFYHRPEFQSDYEERSRTISNTVPAWPWDHSLLSEVLPKALFERLMTFDFQKEPPGVEELSQIRIDAKTRSLTLFASGLNAADIQILFRSNDLSRLEKFTFLDGDPHSTAELLKNLPPHLTGLHLIHSSLLEARPQDSIRTLRKLVDLRLDSNQMKSADLRELIDALPLNLERLAIGFQAQSWTLESAEKFATHPWSKLKSLSLPNNALGRQLASRLLKNVPTSLEDLNLRGNQIPPRDLQEVLGRFQNLKSLDLTSSLLNTAIAFHFPPSLQSLLFYGSTWSALGRLPQSLTQLVLGSQAGEGVVTGLSELFKHLGPNVTRLSLSNAQLKLEDLRTLVKQSSIRHIETLDLSRNNLRDEAIELLSQASFTLANLNLDDNFIQNRGAQIIASRWLGSLKSLSLSQNPISEVGIRTLAEHLPKTLLQLELAGVSGLDVSALSRQLPKELRKLNLARNQITSREIQVLSERLPPNLYELNLEGSIFGPDGAWALASHLPQHLASLNLRMTPIGDLGLQFISQGLPQTLTELRLSEITPSVKTAQEFARHLPPNLRRLEIENAIWHKDAASEVLGALPRSLQRLRLPGVPAGGREGAKKLAAHWPTNLRELDFLGSDLGDEGVIELTQTLPATLEMLQLQAVEMTDRGLTALASRPLEHVSYFNLGQNPFHGVGLAALCSKPRTFGGLEMHGSSVTDQGAKHFNSNCLKTVQLYSIMNQPWSEKTILEFVKKMDPETSIINLSSEFLTHKAMDSFVRNLPERLSILSIAGSNVGEVGIKKLEAEAARRAKLGQTFVIAK